MVWRALAKISFFWLFDLISFNASMFNLCSIQDEYDSYLAYILDQNRVTRHRALYSQIPSITKAKSVAEAVRLQQIRLENLENEVWVLLGENDR